MAEEEWPKPIFRTTIGKTPPRVPKFGTWQQELEVDVACLSSESEEKESGIPAGRGMHSPLGKLKKLGSFFTGSISTPEELPAAHSRQPRAAVRPRYTREFDAARKMKASKEAAARIDSLTDLEMDLRWGVDRQLPEPTPPRPGAAEDAPADLEGAKGEDTCVGNPKRECKLLALSALEALGAALRDTGRTQSSCTSHNDAASGGAALRGAGRSYSTFTNRKDARSGRTGLKEAGRSQRSATSWGDAGKGRKAMSWRDPNRFSSGGAGEEAGRKKQATRQEKAGGRALQAGYQKGVHVDSGPENPFFTRQAPDTVVRQKDGGLSKHTPVFGGWERPTQSDQLSPLSSYSSVFDDLREGRRKKVHGEQLQHLNPVKPTAVPEGQESPPNCPLSSSDGASNSSQEGSRLWEDSYGSSPAASLSEAAYVQQKLMRGIAMEKGGGKGAPVVEDVAKHERRSHTPSASGRMKVELQWTGSEGSLRSTHLKAHARALRSGLLDRASASGSKSDTNAKSMPPLRERAASSKPVACPAAATIQNAPGANVWAQMSEATGPEPGRKRIPVTRKMKKLTKSKSSRTTGDVNRPKASQRCSSARAPGREQPSGMQSSGLRLKMKSSFQAFFALGLLKPS